MCSFWWPIRNGGDGIQSEVDSGQKTGPVLECTKRSAQLARSDNLRKGCGGRLIGLKKEEKDDALATRHGGVLTPSSWGALLFCVYVCACVCVFGFILPLLVYCAQQT